jgi:Holliday junction resolvase
MLEKTLVAKIKKALEAEGAKVIKVHGSSFMEAGTPDLIGCYRGRCFAFEVKRDEKHKPTALQLRRLEEWRKAGAIADVVWTVGMATLAIALAFPILPGKPDPLRRL